MKDYVTFYASGVKYTNRLHKYTVNNYEEAVTLLMSFAAKGFKITAAWYHVEFVESNITDIHQRVNVNTIYSDLLQLSTAEQIELREMTWYYKEPAAKVRFELEKNQPTITDLTNEIEALFKAKGIDTKR